MYILKFKPILKQVLWGGERIIPFKHLSNQLAMVGESWELSAVEGDESVVSEGELEGQTISQLMNGFKGRLVGEENYTRFGGCFPLLIKFIDAAKDLSIQVHPDDAMAKRLYGKMGKSEMWYVMSAKPDSILYSGFSRAITPQEYEERVENDTICEVLETHVVKPGDVFYIPAGRIHSIGAGILVTEIQQTSDLTYRIYDFGRLDDTGKLRKLHTELAREAIDYKVYSDYRVRYTKEENASVPLLEAPCFTTSLYELTEPMVCDYSELDSFVIFICLEGKALLIDDEDKETTISAGETVLIPAEMVEVKIFPEGNIKLLETYV
ncbi:MAG: type I phosphomannose isomerase catalytic subunit [Bacteroidaceae bacterium]